MSLRQAGCALVVLALIAGGCGKKTGETPGGGGSVGGATPESTAGGAWAAPSSACGPTASATPSW